MFYTYTPEYANIGFLSSILNISIVLEVVIYRHTYLMFLLLTLMNIAKYCRLQLYN